MVEIKSCFKGKADRNYAKVFELKDIQAFIEMEDLWWHGVESSGRGAGSACNWFLFCKLNWDAC